MNTPTPDRAEITRALDMLHPEGVVELRALHQKGRKRTSAGYFDPAHRNELIDAATRLNADGAAVYVVLNPLDPQLLGRYANRVEDYAQATATDANITQRHWLLVDIDPQRPKDTSATQEQLEAAMDRARKVYSCLTEHGWPKPVVAESGNGVHLLYRIDLPNDEVSRDLVKGCLEVLAQKFDDATVKIDRSVFNSARIVKLYGTVASKGDNIPTAPWRLSKFRNVPKQIGVVSAELLRALSAEAAKPQALKANGHDQPTGDVRAWTETDVAAFLVRGSIEASGPEPHDGSMRWKLKRCPFNPDHGPTESAVFLKPDGVLGFKCLHNSCADKHWRDLRDLVDPRDLSSRVLNQTALMSSQLDPRMVNAPSDEAPTVALRRGADIEMAPVSWLWSGWLAAGKLHMLGGVPGTGKTTIALSLASVITRGGRWPDGTPFLAPGDVVIWSGEDDAADTLVPRLAAMGADLTRVHFVGHVAEQDGRRPFDPAHDMESLITTARKVGDVRLLIVDPVVTVVMGDSHKNAEVRRGLAPLVTFAQELDAAVLGVTHFSKGTQGRDPLDRLTGSLAFGAAPRLVFAASKKIAEDGTEEGRVLVRVKSNLGPDGGALAYTLSTTELPQGIVTSCIVWGDKIDGSARDILAEAERANDDPSERSAIDEAKDFLGRELAGGAVAPRDLEKHARDAGIAWATVRRAKDALCVVARKADFSGGWQWDLPPKMLKGAQDAHTKVQSALEGNEHLRAPSGDQEAF